MAYKLTKKSNLGKVAEKCPQAIGLLSEYGLACANCHMRIYETVEEGAKIHGLSDSEIARMIKDINARLTQVTGID